MLSFSPSSEYISHVYETIDQHLGAGVQESIVRFLEDTLCDADASCRIVSLGSF
ncbi:hypothetical protein COCMIDRAFT_84478 [Bipolaris oryzae ATCC 44560]|uniref:Uncharacterized protein n=1 Tax=Bipolaris oryzae ATCC 44560 TaxID=930090 RepID=W6ZCJ4_COCMI|nr:uncharacterized protein COCMIDRAFT_84478 [Bipolaris oryzae ATCC 44560]EUC49532.1 hypothetical protein COCMIDRAFT_84478 [Bipolaris oryzae ATCC 44560]